MSTAFFLRKYKEECSRTQIISFYMNHYLTIQHFQKIFDSILIIVLIVCICKFLYFLYPIIVISILAIFPQNMFKNLEYEVSIQKKKHQIFPKIVRNMSLRYQKLEKIILHSSGSRYKVDINYVIFQMH